MRSVRLLRALTILTVAFSASACTALDDAMVAIFGRSMRSQASFDPYENTRMPAEGAISFSSGNFPPAPGEVNIGEPLETDYTVPDFTQAATAVPPGTAVLQNLQNPVPADSASLARGQVIYNRTCIVCHGPEGIGADALIVDKWPALQVDNLAGPQVQGYPDGYIYGMIRVGRGLMPSYAHQITHFDRWNVINYVRRLQAQYNANQAQAADSAGAGGER
jgi:mono/diheme cytochrome c family protein